MLILKLQKKDKMRLSTRVILLLSRQDDGSTREVAEWLFALQKNFIRLNADDKKNRFLNCDIQAHKFTFLFNNKPCTFLVSDIKSAWFRRSGFSKESLVDGKGLNNLFHKPSFFASEHLKEEAQEIFEFIYYLLQSKPQLKNIGNPFYNAVNKLIVLNLARSLGLKIPLTHIVSSKKELKTFTKKNTRLITKSIGNGVYRFTDEYGYYSYTERVTPEFIDTLPDNYFPSLVQGEIVKKYELRIFYLERKFYSMAIFSGEFEATAIDNRKNFETPSLPRRVPYLLPKSIEKYLSLLMKKLKLNTGSIDMIVTREKEFYFLEVNPIGQFGMVSEPCNYYLEKKIAQAL